MGAHCMQDNGAGSTSSCTLTGVVAGDLIVVETIGRTGSSFTVTDTSSQTYTSVYFTTDASNPSVSGMSYHANSSSGNITVQSSVTGSTYSVVFAQAWHNAAASTPLDATFSSSFVTTSTVGTVTNGNCGTARTPGNANSLVLSLGAFDAVTPTVGTNYSIVDTDATNTAYKVQGWIQTTATSTNGAWVSAADDWSVGCAAFHP